MRAQEREREQNEISPRVVVLPEISRLEIDLRTPGTLIVCVVVVVRRKDFLNERLHSFFE